VIADPQGVLARQWGIKVFTSTVLVDSSGRVHSVVQGELDWMSLEARRLLHPLLATTASVNP
jgi:hypothetical protein